MGLSGFDERFIEIKVRQSAVIIPAITRIVIDKCKNTIKQNR